MRPSHTEDHPWPRCSSADRTRSRRGGVGVDLRQPLDDATFATIKRASLDHFLLCFPGQDVTREQFIAFARRFGTPDDNASVKHRDPKTPYVTMLSSKPFEGKPWEGFKNGESWLIAIVRVRADFVHAVARAGDAGCWWKYDVRESGTWATTRCRPNCGHSSMICKRFICRRAGVRRGRTFSGGHSSTGEVASGNETKGPLHRRACTRVRGHDRRRESAVPRFLGHSRDAARVLLSAHMARSRPRDVGQPLPYACRGPRLRYEPRGSAAASLEVQHPWRGDRPAVREVIGRRYELEIVERPHRRRRGRQPW